MENKSFVLSWAKFNSKYFGLLWVELSLLFIAIFFPGAGSERFFYVLYPFLYQAFIPKWS